MAQLIPYISFTSGAQAALEYYQSVFGGEVTLSLIGDTPEVAASFEGTVPLDALMHGELTVPGGFTLYASDMGEHDPATAEPAGFSYAYTGTADEEDAIRQAFDTLASEGEVILPLEAAPWGGIYGQVHDKFSIRWQFNIETGE